MFTWLFYGALAFGLVMAIASMWKLFLVIAVTLAVMWVVLGIIPKHFVRQHDAKALKRATLLKHAEEQHQAIIDGKYARGHYGEYPSAVPAHCIDDLEDNERPQT